MAFVYDSIKIEGAQKKYLLKATAACVSFGMAKDRKLLYCRWGGSLGRLKWRATGEKHLSDVFLSIDQLQSDRGLDLAEQTNWILTSYVFFVAWIIFFFTDGIYLLPTSYYYDFHK